MFRHSGKSRTYIHNLRLAAMLSFVAGTVNICGVLSVKVLTTNVTGHFAYFSEEVAKGTYSIAVVYLFFILSFLAGAFVSGLLVETVRKKSIVVSYTLPLVIEILLLGSVAFWGREAHSSLMNGQFIAYILLFAMGLQNALVTKVSQSVVRTTHLTGLFTDLGIELSQLSLRRAQPVNKKLYRGIYLKLAIISCFFVGCLLGGVLYQEIRLMALLLAIFTLIVALFYDRILFRYYVLRRKIRLKDPVIPHQNNTP